jgi:hypothetical protein
MSQECFNEEFTVIYGWVMTTAEIDEFLKYLNPEYDDDNDSAPEDLVTYINNTNSQKYEYVCHDYNGICFGIDVTKHFEKLCRYGEPKFGSVQVHRFDLDNIAKITEQYKFEERVTSFFSENPSLVFITKEY